MDTVVGIALFGLQPVFPASLRRILAITGRTPAFFAPIVDCVIGCSGTISMKLTFQRTVSRPRRSCVNVSSVSSSRWEKSAGERKPWNGQDAVELFVASYEDARKLAQDARESAAGAATSHRYPERRKVASPKADGHVSSNRFAVARPAVKATEVAAKEQFAHHQQSSKALKAELDVATGDLRAKTAEVSKLAKVVRHQDREISELKATVADRDAKLKASKQDLLESRMRLQEKDNLLQTAYEALTTACKERSDLRRQLIEVQAELQDTRQELRKWTDEMAQLKSVMDALDAAEADSASAALADAMAMARSGSGPGAASQGGEGSWADEGVASLLKELTALTQQVVAEAAEDERVYQQAMGHTGTAALRSGGNAAYW